MSENNLKETSGVGKAFKNAVVITAACGLATGCASKAPPRADLIKVYDGDKPFVMPAEEKVITREVSVQTTKNIVVPGFETRTQVDTVNRTFVPGNPDAACEADRTDHTKFRNRITGKPEIVQQEGRIVPVTDEVTTTTTTRETVPGGVVSAGLRYTNVRGSGDKNVMLIATTPAVNPKDWNAEVVETDSTLKQVGGLVKEVGQGVGNIALGAGAVIFGLNFKPATSTTTVSNGSGSSSGTGPVTTGAVSNGSTSSTGAVSNNSASTSEVGDVIAKGGAGGTVGNVSSGSVSTSEGGAGGTVGNVSSEVGNVAGGTVGDVAGGTVGNVAGGTAVSGSVSGAETNTCIDNKGGDTSNILYNAPVTPVNTAGNVVVPVTNNFTPN